METWGAEAISPKAPSMCCVPHIVCGTVASHPSIAIIVANFIESSLCPKQNLSAHGGAGPIVAEIGDTPLARDLFVSSVSKGPLYPMECGKSKKYACILMKERMMINHLPIPTSTICKQCCRRSRPTPFGHPSKHLQYLDCKIRHH